MQREMEDVELGGGGDDNSRRSPTPERTIVRMKAALREGANTINFTVTMALLVFLTQFSISVLIVVVTVIGLFTGAFDEREQNVMLHLTSFIIGIWLPHPQTLMQKHMKPKRKQHHRRRRF